MKENIQHPQSIKQSEEKAFTGFPSPERNYFPMPNAWTNITSEIDSLAELKIIEYVIRHTWGYQEYNITKAITHDEFMHGRKRIDGSRIDKGTGLSEKSVKDGTKRAIEHGYIYCDVNDRDKARIKKSYALKMSSNAGGVESIPQNQGGISYPSGQENLPPRTKESTHQPGESTRRTEKDTREKHLKKNTSSSSYTLTREETSLPLLTTAATTLSLSQLKDFSSEDLAVLKAEIDALLRDQEGTDQAPQPFKEIMAAPDVQNVQYDQNNDDSIEEIKEVVGHQALERPGENAPRTAETVVQLVEYLRTAPYPAKERSFELRKAGVLLSLKEIPDVSMAEIEEAWLHGSDDYWRSKHAGDDLHVHDLVNKDSNGKVRIQAFLEHKRAQDRRAQRQPSHDPQAVSFFSPAPAPAIPVSILSEEQAWAIVEQIAQDAQEHGYSSLHGSVQAQEGAGWIVRVSWLSIGWKGDLGLEIYSEHVWPREFAVWRETLQLREHYLQQRLAAKGK